jgi:hypothetical protein
MSIEVRQDSSYSGGGWWKWSVWLEGTKQELDEVRHVRYVLHSSFRNPEREVTDRNSRFRLDARALGEFMLYVFIHKKSGRVTKREHWVRLLRGGTVAVLPGSKARRPPRAGTPAVFISSSVTELPLVRALGESLKAGGVDVLIPSDDQSGLSWDASLNALLERADSAVFIFSGDPGKWVEREIVAASTHKLPILPVILVGPRNKAKVPRQLKDHEPLYIKMLSEAPDGRSVAGLELTKLADRIRSML